MFDQIIFVCMPTSRRREMKRVKLPLPSAVVLILLKRGINIHPDKLRPKSWV